MFLVTYKHEHTGRGDYLRMNGEQISFRIENQISRVIKVEHCRTMHTADDRMIVAWSQPNLSNLVPAAEH